MNKIKLFASFLIVALACCLCLFAHAPMTAILFTACALLVVHNSKSLSRRLRAFGVCLALLFVALAILPIKAQVRNRGATVSFGDVTLVSMNVYPEDNSTNVVQFWDARGTNFFRISPSNAAPEVMLSNTLYTALAATNIILTNSQGGAGSTRILQFRNGLLTGVLQ